MLILVKSYPDSLESKVALELACNTEADVVFLQNGVYHMGKEDLWALAGKVYYLDEDLRMRGLQTPADAVGYHDVVDLMAEADKVTGLI